MTERKGLPAPPLATWAFFVDFDGTITDRDTFDVLVQRFGGPEAWARTERDLEDGSATIRDVLQVQAGYVRGTYAEVAALLRREIAVDPTFPDFVAFWRARGATLEIVSSGIEPVIRERLEAVGVRDVPIIANGIDPDPAGWKIVYRDGSANGTDKAAVVRGASARGASTVFIGDGRSDYAAAILAERRFAKRGRPLERYLRERGIAYEPYSSFADVTAALLGDERRPHVREAVAADVPAIARVHVDAWRETYPGMFPRAVLDALTYDEREREWKSVVEAGDCGLFVAEANGAVVGFACGGRNREAAYALSYPGELYAIYLLAAYQRAGLGRALFDAVRAWLDANDLPVFLLWVVDGNPSCAFYERLGGVRILTQPAEIRGAQVIEAAYAWR